MTKHIVIVGGGAAAVSVFAHLAATPTMSRVTFVAPGPIGLGTAFGTTDPALLCNTSVDVTSLRADGRSDLLDYLAARGHPVHHDDFVPRYLVGQYCRERFLRLSKSTARAGVRVTHIRDRAVGMARTGREYRVELADGGSVSGTDIVFCAGVDIPFLPPLVRPYEGHPRLILSPHPARRLRLIPEDARVLVLGTKQSAIDAVLVLCGSGRRRVVMTSPSGMLPAVRNRLRRWDVPRLHNQQWTQPHRDDAAFDRALARRLVAAIRTVDPRQRVRPATVAGVAAEVLGEESALAVQRRVPWEDVMAELIDTLNATVPRWPAEARARVLPRYHALMTRYISAIPVRNAELLSRYLDKGGLAVAPRYPDSAAPGPDRWTVRWPDGSTEVFDHIVCATGYRVGPLIVTGAGVRVGGPEAGPRPEILGNLRLRLAPGQPAERIWVVGAASGSRFPIVNYLRAAAQHAAIVAEQFSRQGDAEALPIVERTTL